MGDRIIELCPFLIKTETLPNVLVGETTTTTFEPCLKEACPAFYVDKGYTYCDEHCKRLDK